MGGGDHSHLVGSSYPQLAPKPVGQRIANIYKQRISQFTSTGQWEKVNLLSMMNEGTASGAPHVKLAKWSAPGQERPTFAEAVSHDFEKTEVGAWFGPSWSTHWFRAEITVPKELRDKERLEFHWDSNSEAMIWSAEGEPLQGLTGGGERVEWLLPEKEARSGITMTVYIEMACNGMFGNAGGGDSIQPPNPNRQFQLARAEVVAVFLPARQLFIDIWIIGDAAREFPTDSWQQHQAMEVATRIIDAFERGNQESVKRGRVIAQEYLGKKIDSAAVYGDGGDDEKNKNNTANPPLVFGIGHCHIDTCWLWPWDETKRKVARSWTNQCNLMEQYPELRFACSQAQQYKWLKQYYPSVFERVSARVASGQFHPIGGSWVEHDTNLPSGESLVRQFLYGQRFFEGHFGARCQTFWLPDTFGYSAQLPQLCRLSGMTRFLTQKLSWNNINKFPHTTFNWVALDGSQVVCHMPPSETYTAEAHFGDVRRSMTQHKSLDQDHTSLLVFGKGDGGGGPTWQHLEKLRRCRGMADTVGLLPRVHMGSSVDDFFAPIEAKAAKAAAAAVAGAFSADNSSNEGLSTWYGELYFELHRGTYTTQANNKRNNRRAEFVLRGLEMLATVASLASTASAASSANGTAYHYPKAAIDEMWEATLLCQFHDCLPGSSIEMCYDDSDVLYAKLFATAEKLLKDILKVMGLVGAQGPAAGLPGTEDRMEEDREEEETSNSKGSLLALNMLPFPRKEIVEISPTECAVAAGEGPLLPLLPLARFTPGTWGEAPVSVQETRKGVFVLQNMALRVTVQDGAITSIYDRAARREVISPGQRANQYVIFDDKPLYWQAWDVEVYHLDTRRELQASATYIGERLPHRVSIVTETQISAASHIRTTIGLSAALDGEPPLVEVTSDVEWHETMQFLKVEFPVAVRNTEATYETQFGLVRRPTHYNTSWDMAKFEVCCHKFADLSENGYGVSILNDGKYGFATVGSLMRLSLLRAPKAPDAHADMGHHRMRWAILPHQGVVGAATVRKAYEFNAPLALVRQAVTATTETAAVSSSNLLSTLGRPPITISGDAALVLDTVKRAEDDADVRAATAKGSDGPHLRSPRTSRSVILRIYDSLGGRARGTVHVTAASGWPVARVFKTNLLEDDLEGVPYTAAVGGGGGSFDIDLRAFEVATYRLEMDE